MRSLKGVCILGLIKDNGETEEFRIGDKIKVNLRYPSGGSLKKETHIGIIKFIELASLEMDASKEYQSIINNLKYKPIESIEKI